MRCVYHGWKFAADGQVPGHAEPAAEQDFSEKVRAKAYQVTERAGVIWVYMGAREVRRRCRRSRRRCCRQRTLAEFHPARMQLVAGAGRRHRHLAFQLAACRLGAARAGRCGQLAAISGGQSGAGVSGRRYRLGHDVLRVPSGGGWQDILAVRAFRLSVLDVHSAGRLRGSGDRARLGADGRHACDVRRLHLEAGVAHGGAEGRRADPGLDAGAGLSAEHAPTGSAAGGRCRTRRTTI